LAGCRTLFSSSPPSPLPASPARAVDMHRYRKLKWPLRPLIVS
jgi:hypothetical protein